MSPNLPQCRLNQNLLNWTSQSLLSRKPPPLKKLKPSRKEVADPALPYADGTELSLWTSAPNMMGPASVLGISSYADFSTTQYAEELTGISINWIEVTYETMSEQFNILVASGDSPDLMYNAITMYNGGGGKAFEDGILANLSEYLEENAPNYCAYLNADEKMMLESKDD